MDVGTALSAVNEALQAIDTLRATASGVGGRRNANSAELDDIARSKVAVCRAVAVIDAPSIAQRLIPYAAPFGTHWQGARHALVEWKAILEARDRIDAIVGPRGPQLSAGSLHELIWGSAARLWDDGYPIQAVQSASSALEAALRARLRRPDLIGQDLGAGFSTDPPNDSWPTRLRIRGLEPDTPSWRSAHDGAVALVRGAFMYVRNLASHGGTCELDETEALEQLALLSLVARILDRCDLAVLEEPSGDSS